MYIVGGRVGSREWFDSSEVYDFSKAEWLEGPNLPYSLKYPSAITSKTQHVCLVIGWNGSYNEKFIVMIFDDELGFKEISSTDALELNYYLTGFSIE